MICAVVITAANKDKSVSQLSTGDSDNQWMAGSKATLPPTYLALACFLRVVEPSPSPANRIRILCCHVLIGVLLLQVHLVS
jgi:hypothetical protein